MLYWLTMIHNKYLDRKLKNLHYDGGEIHSDVVESYLRSVGTRPHVNVAAQHEQNSRAECGIRVINDMERAMRVAGNAPKSHWE